MACDDFTSSGLFFLPAPAASGPPASLMDVCYCSICWNASLQSNGPAPEPAVSAPSGLLLSELGGEGTEQGAEGTHATISFLMQIVNMKMTSLNPSEQTPAVIMPHMHIFHTH